MVLLLSRATKKRELLALAAQERAMCGEFFCGVCFFALKEMSLSMLWCVRVNGCVICGASLVLVVVDVVWLFWLLWLCVMMMMMVKEEALRRSPSPLGFRGADHKK